MVPSTSGWPVGEILETLVWPLRAWSACAPASGCPGWEPPPGMAGEGMKRLLEPKSSLTAQIILHTDLL